MFQYKGGEEASAEARREDNRGVWWCEQVMFRTEHVLCEQAPPIGPFALSFAPFAANPVRASFRPAIGRLRPSWGQ
jgi:hypothetical protein